MDTTKYSFIIDGRISESFIVDRFYTDVFRLPNIKNTRIEEMDDQTLGYYDPKTLLEIALPS